MDAVVLDFDNDIGGDSLPVGYRDKIEIMSYGHNVAMQITNDANSSERTSDKPHVGEFTLTKFIDAPTPTPNEYCYAGKPIAEATITTSRDVAESNRQIMSLIIYTLSNVVLSNVSVSDGTGGRPVEALSLSFTKIEWELTAQKNDGTKEGMAASIWDLATNQLVK